MKNFKILLFLLLSLSLGFYSCGNDDDDNVIPKSSAKSITEFKVNDQVATIDESAKTVKITFPFGTDITKVKPTIKISDKATVSPASGAEVNLTSAVTYTVTAEDESKQEYIVTATVAKSSAADILTFAFNSLDPKVTATVDANAKTVVAEVPYGTNVTALKPTITISGESVSPASDVAQNFTNPVKYTVTAANGDKKEFTVTVKLGELNPEITNLDKNSMMMGESVTLTGKFLKADNKVEFRNFEGTVKQALEITAQSETSITAKLTADLNEGEYLVYVICGSKEASADPKRVAVIKSTDPKIISLEKTQFVQGLDKINITGVNFKGSGVKVYFKKEGATTPYKTYASPTSSNNYTVLWISNVDDLEIGKQVVYVIVDGVKSNEFALEIVANTNPVPTITSISPSIPVQGGKVTVTGTNLGDIFDTHVLVYSYNAAGNFILWADMQILAEKTDNTINFTMPTLVNPKFKLKVRVKGKLSDFTPEYTSTK